MRVAIVKYNAGNTASVANSLRRLGAEPIITDDAEMLASADRVIFPGVGEASTAMNYLQEHGLDDVIRSLGQPVLGICLGMQLLCESSDENETSCLGILPLRVRRFPKNGLKVPHVGWNSITDLRGPLFRAVEPNTYLYFVHGFYVEQNPWATASCDYGIGFCAGLTYANFHAVQFHPEKSGSAGELILDNFLSL